MKRKSRHRGRRKRRLRHREARKVNRFRVQDAIKRLQPKRLWGLPAWMRGVGKLVMLGPTPFTPPRHYVDPSSALLACHGEKGSCPICDMLVPVEGMPNDEIIAVTLKKRKSATPAPKGITGLKADYIIYDDPI